MKLTVTIAIASLTILAALGHSVSAAEIDETSTADHHFALIGAETAGASASHSPGSVGAMSAAVGGTAVSADDVLRQSRGQLTASPVYWRASAQNQPGF